MKEWIKNKSELAASPRHGGASPGREGALKIIEAGFEAIDTQKIVESAVSLKGNVLKIKDHVFDLKNFKKIKVAGFGKVAGSVAAALEKILVDKISAGAVIDVSDTPCARIKTFVGSHPEPSLKNVAATRHIVDLADDVSREDLFLVIVSGGGSALLCWPEEECFQGQKLYQEFLKSGGTIHELNTVRKYISALKGGGLAKLFYPATVVGLIFCDISADACGEVASGPTFKDQAGLAAAQKILDKYGIGGLKLSESPQDNIYFERVSNVLMVSNREALSAMSQQAENLGLKAKIISSEIYESAPEAMEKFIAAAGNRGERTAVLAG